jgi:hypothetical protein
MCVGIKKKKQCAPPSLSLINLLGPGRMLSHERAKNGGVPLALLLRGRRILPFLTKVQLQVLEAAAMPN